MRVRVILPVIALLGLAACGEDGPNQTGSTTPTNPPPASSSAPTNPTSPSSSNPAPAPTTPSRP